MLYNRNFTLLILCLLLSPFLLAQPIKMDLLKGMKARNIGPAGMSGRVTAIDVLHTNPNIIYIGTASGGAWRSENGGLSWKPIFEKEKSISVGAIAINQNNPNEIWIGTGEGNPRNSISSGYGVYKTIDGGKSWTYMGLGETRNIHRLIIHRDDPNTIIVGAIGSPWGEHAERGVFKTTDGGQSWKKVLYVDEKTGCADLVVDPSNPNKLIAAMWEHRRWPWYFKSGGSGSGMYVSFDGGESWKKRTHEDGLPKGELGRMGLAIAPSKPNIVYALIEAKKTGLYKSEDGGFKWKKVADKGIGNRPFYYADIFVDTKNENRIYNLYTFVDVSNDGGKTFKRFINANLIHVDNHAWWGHPENPNFLICGNDGGMCISRDGGKTWDFMENLPLAQFYHINTDNAVPYNVYGGMQDNGSWRGPSQVWRRKGIRNLYWNRIGVGDGFDVVPDLLEPRFGYSMSQGGNLSRFDLETGAYQRMRPILESGEPLRFNWNAGIALDPFDQKTLYYGSQFVLKSTDKGNSWEKISPDLTTNDPEKQKQLTTGGLTLDNTGAENFTTILTIEPSSVKQGVIWVGTDDGQVQLTKDGGQNWTNLTVNINGMPKGAWIPQISASKTNADEAFVVVNDYRRNNWKPYLFKTTNAGKSWTNLVNEDQIWGYCLSLAQDPIEPKLLFLGTESGLYVSIDAGKHWTKWVHGYPNVSTMDMKIHPREHDLVIGTFGRAAWILDDIRPLRELAKQGQEQVLTKDLVLFPIPNAYQNHLGEPHGYRSTGDGLFVGENRQQGALISYYLKEVLVEKEKKDKKKVTLKVYTENNEHIRTLKFDPKKGFNRITWDLTKRGLRLPNTPKPKKESPELSGNKVIPGNYKIVIAYGDFETEQMLKVIADPKIPMTQAQLVAKAAMIDRHEKNIEKMTQKTDQLRAAIENIDWLNQHLEEKEKFKAIIEQGKTLKAKIKDIMALINPPSDVQGLSRNPALISTKIYTANRLLQTTIFPPSDNQDYAIERVEQHMKPVIEKIDQFFQQDWATYQEMIADAKISLIKDF